jgi:hypothetical protein
MLRKIGTIILLLGLILLVSMVFPGRQEQYVVKPIKGKFSGIWTAQSWDTVIPALDKEEGTFPHLGYSTYSGVLTTTWSGLVGSVSGTITLVAANGDKLYVAVSGTQTLDPSYIFADFAGSHAITSGTGRFVGATGTGSIGAHLTIDPTFISGLLQNGYMDGNIKLPLP